MNDRDRYEPSAEQKRIAEVIRSLPGAGAEAGFRDRLRAEFAAGRLDPAPGPGGQRPVPRRVWWRVMIPLATAIVLAVLVLFNGGPPLSLSDVSGDGTVTVDGRPFPTTDRHGVAGAVQPGAEVVLSEGVEIDLVYERTLAIQMSSAIATVPAAPGRWFGTTVDSRLEMGEMRILTGAGFAGGSLRVTTPEGEIVITGSLVSVFRDGAVTCVCVHRGTARVGIDAGDMQDIPAGKRKVMYADGKPPVVTDVAPPHVDHLVDFEKKYRSGIRPVR